MVSIKDTLLDDFWPVALMIKRLKFEREASGKFYLGEADDICDFVNLEEVHLVCAGGLGGWHGVSVMRVENTRPGTHNLDLSHGYLYQDVMC